MPPHTPRGGRPLHNWNSAAEPGASAAPVVLKPAVPGPAAVGYAVAAGRSDSRGESPPWGHAAEDVSHTHKKTGDGKVVRRPIHRLNGGAGGGWIFENHISGVETTIPSGATGFPGDAS